MGSKDQGRQVPHCCRCLPHLHIHGAQAPCRFETLVTISRLAAKQLPYELVQPPSRKRPTVSVSRRPDRRAPVAANSPAQGRSCCTHLLGGRHQTGIQHHLARPDRFGALFLHNHVSADRHTHGHGAVRHGSGIARRAVCRTHGQHDDYC
jgi:hypothetical protein